ncbi:MAG: leucine-rich repeat domain-containing protein [Treponema sp.]|nr:leucine-rich repeat domain-containing protein [Treponema sp.]
MAGNLSALTIPDSVTKLSLAGSTLTSLTGLTLPASLTNSGFSYAFKNSDNLTDLTGLTGLTLPAGITSMASWFSECDGITNLDGVTIPNGVTRLNSCFQNCKGLVDAGGLTIPSSVDNMFYCFANCTSLTTAPVIPSSVSPTASSYQRLQGLFKGCTSLSGTITINAKTSENSHWSEAFDDVDPTKIDKIKVPDAPTRNNLLANYPAFAGKVFILGEDGYND